MIGYPDRDVGVRSVLTRARLLQIFAALGRAGIAPIATADLHAFAFFANVMSPLWDLDPLDGAVLKLPEGPYYPFLQAEVDQLVGSGFLEVEHLAYRTTEGGVVQLDASFRPVPDHCRKVLEIIEKLPDETETSGFLNELAFAFAEIRVDLRDDAAIVDATYSNPAIADERVIDFAQWNDPSTADSSVIVADRFQKYAPAGMTLNRAEKLLLYMRLMKRRVHV